MAGKIAPPKRKVRGKEGKGTYMPTQSNEQLCTRAPDRSRVRAPAARAPFQDTARGTSDTPRVSRRSVSHVQHRVQVTGEKEKRYNC